MAQKNAPHWTLPRRIEWPAAASSSLQKNDFWPEVHSPSGASVMPSLFESGKPLGFAEHAADLEATSRRES